jgi:hypothetical protein
MESSFEDETSGQTRLSCYSLCTKSARKLSSERRNKLKLTSTIMTRRTVNDVTLNGTERLYEEEAK